MVPLLTFLGHNCFLVETESSSILIDPWFSKSGSFYGSWMQYPSNHHLADRARNALTREHALLLLSHEHGDHFDREFLAGLPPGLEAGVVRFDDRFLADELRQFNLRVTELDEGTSLQCGDLAVQFFRVDEGTASDAAILIEGNGFRFLNQNDCKMFDRLSDVPLPLTHYAVQFSGASWYPECFDYDAQTKRRRSAESVANKIRNVQHALEVLEPDVFVPSAGPVVFPFLSSDFGKPDSSVFVHQDELDSRLAVPRSTAVCFARPGDQVEAGERSNPIPPPSEAELEWYRRNCVDVWSHLPDHFEPNDLVEEVRQRLVRIAGLAPADTPAIEFIWGPEAIDRCVINLHDGSVELGGCPAGGAPSVEITAERKYFRLLIENPRWQEVVLTFRAQIRRSPDQFNNWVNLFLYSDPTSIEDNFKNAQVGRTERFEFDAGDFGRFTAARWCPHQGADLATAVIDGSCVVCPRHGWRFDLEQGGVDVRSGTSINAIRVREPRPGN